MTFLIVFFFFFTCALSKTPSHALPIPTRRGHYTTELCLRSVGISRVMRWLSSPVHGSTAAAVLIPFSNSQEEAAQECSRLRAQLRELQRVELTELVSPSGNKPAGLKPPRHDDKNVPWPKRISLTIRWTPFGSRGWLSRRVLRSWKWGSLCFFLPRRPASEQDGSASVSSM